MLALRKNQDQATASRFVVIHYDEIGLKAGNRRRFEKLLLNNIKAKLGERLLASRRETGQITLELQSGADPDAALDTLARVPGIANLGLAKRVPHDLDTLKKEAVAFALNSEFKTFKIDTRRHDKEYPLKSIQVNEELGGAVLEACPDKQVRLQGPDLEIRVEITHRHAYFSAERIQGVGGLPTDPGQKVIALLSGGLDSPVAAYFMMKRGCQVTFVHFQNQSQMADSVADKIERLTEQLSRYQVGTKLWLVPFGGLQKEIIMHAPASQRMLVYRRLMLRLASQLAAEAGARFLIVGDSFSQVASQTYENLDATYASASKHVLTPLIGLDKREITALARTIGTYEISTLPYGDCCSYFIPKHPELRGDAAALAEIEARIDLDALGTQALAQAQVREWS